MSAIPRISTSLVLAVLLGSILAGVAPAQTLYSEDFTTDTYKHATFTSADWNTVDGELKFPPFTLIEDWRYTGVGNVRNLEAAHGYIFVAQGAEGLQVYNPIGWGPDASVNTPGYCWDVVVQGEYAYVADGASGLQVVDISNPVWPSIVGAYNTTGYAYDVEVDGGRAYICDGSGGFRMINVSNPAGPTLLGTAVTSGSARSAKVRGHLAYVCDDHGYLRIYDVSTAGNPTQVGFVAMGGINYGVDIAGKYAFIAAASSGLRIVDVSDPASPVLITTVSTSGTAQDVEISGNSAFVANYTSGLAVFDISDPTTPVIVESRGTDAKTYGVCTEGNRVHTADDTGGVRQFTFATHVSPADVTHFDTGDNVRDVELHGNLAFVAASANGLRILDITDVSAPVEIGSLPSGDETIEVEVGSGYAYVADLSNGLRIVDVSDPTAPVDLGSVPVSHASHVEMQGSILYLSDGIDGFKVYDISNPSTPILTDSYAMSPQAAGKMCLQGDKVYVAGNYGGLYVFDVANPYAISLLGRADTAGQARDVDVRGNFAFVADRQGGIRVFDVFSPVSMPEVGGYPTTENVESITIRRDRAYVGIGFGGILVLDISSPGQPQFAGSLEGAGYAYDVVGDGDHLLVADGIAGVWVVQHMQSEWDTTGNLGWSLEIDGAEAPIARARLAATSVGDVSWQLSSTGSGNWVDVTPDDQWVELPGFGSSLTWKSSHAWVYGTNSAVSGLQIDWLNRFARVQSVLDVPDDQGRQVRIEWMRSGHDFIDDATQIVEYAVYRKIDAGMAKRAPIGLTDESPVVQEHAARLSATWDFVISVPVRVEDYYAVVVPTLADSTVTEGLTLSTFMVSALTSSPGVYFDSPEMSGYSVDNLAPGAPTGLVAHYAQSEVVLDWNDAPEEDFRYFRVYRSSQPDFEPSQSNLVDQVGSSAWTDGTADAWDYTYKITAVDLAGNESDVATMESATGVPQGSRDHRFVLHAAAPNPFNPRTTISWALPMTGRARLQVFDIGGRLIATLFDEVKDAGPGSMEWDGTDKAGRRVSSGVYLYKLQAADFEDTRRMVLVK